MRLIRRDALERFRDNLTVTSSHFLPEMVILARTTAPDAGDPGDLPLPARRLQDHRHVQDHGHRGVVEHDQG